MWFARHLRPAHRPSPSRRVGRPLFDPLNHQAADAPAGSREGRRTTPRRLRARVFSPRSHARCGRGPSRDVFEAAAHRTRAPALSTDGRRTGRSSFGTGCSPLEAHSLVLSGRPRATRPARAVCTRERPGRATGPTCWARAGGTRPTSATRATPGATYVGGPTESSAGRCDLARTKDMRLGGIAAPIACAVPSGRLWAMISAITALEQPARARRLPPLPFRAARACARPARVA